MFSEHYGQPPARLWFSFQAMVVLLCHRGLRSRRTGLDGCSIPCSAQPQPQAPPTASSWPPQSRIPINPPSYSFGDPHIPRAELRAQKRFCSHTDLAPSIPCPNPCHTATRPFSPSLHRIKLSCLGASALAVSALFIEILWLFSSKSPPAGVLI